MVPVELLDRCDELLAGLGPLNQRVSGDDPYRRPASPRILHDIAFGCAASSDEANRPWQEGQRLLQRRVEEPLGLEQSFGLLQPGEQPPLANGGDGIAGKDEKRPELSKYVGLMCATTVAPSVSGPAESRVVGEAVTDTETSASLSRKVRKIVRVPERRLISINCASTQTAPSRSTQPRTARAITRRGWGCSGEDSKATT